MRRRIRLNGSGFRPDDRSCSGLKKLTRIQCSEWAAYWTPETKRTIAVAGNSSPYSLTSVTSRMGGSTPSCPARIEPRRLSPSWNVLVRVAHLFTKQLLCQLSYAGVFIEG